MIITGTSKGAKNIFRRILFPGKLPLAIPKATNVPMIVEMIQEKKATLKLKRAAPYHFGWVKNIRYHFKERLGGGNWRYLPGTKDIGITISTGKAKKRNPITPKKHKIEWILKILLKILFKKTLLRSDRDEPTY